jgi:stage V sporulation protein G
LGYLDVSRQYPRGGPVEITEVKLTLRNEERLKGFANITFDNAFVIRGLKIINGSKGLFISMPSKRRSDGSFQDIAHPINPETRKMIEDTVLNAYNSEVDGDHR